MRFVAIVTYGRTGSTVLQAALNASDGVLIRGENYNIFRQFESSYQIARKIRKQRNQMQTLDSDPWFGCERINPEELLEEQKKMAITQVLRPESHTQVLGFKEIRYEPAWFENFQELIEYLVYLERLFPGIRFVVNRRSPFETAKSSWWGQVPDRERRLGTAHEWMGNLPEYLDSRLARPAAILTEYEDWQSDPEALRPVWKFLEIEWNSVLMSRVISTKLTH